MRILTPQLRARGRLLPCAALREMLESLERQKTTRLSANRINALKLAALQVAIAKNLTSAEFDTSPLDALSFRETYCDGVQMYSNLGLRVFGEECPINLAVNSGLTKILHGLSDTLVREAVIWAPPVIAPARGNKPAVVVGNQIPFALHRHCFPGETVNAKTLNFRPSWHLTANELSNALLARFSGLVAAHRITIVRAARTGKDAAVLAGIGTTRAAELRAEHGVLTE